MRIFSFLLSGMSPLLICRPGAIALLKAVNAVTATSAPPRVGDIVHYWPLLAERSGCKAAIVTDLHVDPQLATLIVFCATGIQFVQQARLAEPGFTWETFEPGTWHVAGHQ